MSNAQVELLSQSYWLRDDWQDHLYAHVRDVARGSRHRDVKVAAVIYNLETKVPLTYGVNSLPNGLDATREEFHVPPLKDLVWVHAETNSIYSAARQGISTFKRGMAVTWYPCAPCAASMVSAGIVEMIGVEPDWTSAKWGPSWLAAEEILMKAGVKVHFVKQAVA